MMSPKISHYLKLVTIYLFAVPSANRLMTSSSLITVYVNTFSTCSHFDKAMLRFKHVCKDISIIMWKIGLILLLPF